MDKLRNIAGCLLVMTMAIASSQSQAAPITLLEPSFTLAMGERANFGRSDIPNGSFTDYWGFSLVDVDNALVTKLTLSGVTSGMKVFLDTDESDGGVLDTDDFLLVGQVPSTGVLSLSGLITGAQYIIEVAGNSFRKPRMYAGEVAAVPLPAAAVLFGSALLGFAGFATRHRIS